MSGFLSFPNPVNEKAARTVAGLVLGLVPAEVCVECADFGARPAPSR